jgi:phenylacetate-CoA ligase
MISPDFGALLYKPVQEIQDLQNELLRKQIYRLSHYSPYYIDLFQRLGIKPDKIRTTDDLQEIPLLYKRDYMKEPERFRLVYSDQDQEPMYEKILWNALYTTGTTIGKPSPFYSTTHDYFVRLVQMSRMCNICGITASDTVANIFPLNYVPHIGYIGTIDYAVSVGAKVVCALTGTPYPGVPLHHSLNEAVDMVESQRATVLSGLPSFIRRLIMRAQERGKDFSSVRKLFLTGEACPEGMQEDMKSRLKTLGALEVTARKGIGFTEMQGCTIECSEGSGMHMTSPDFYFFEICDEFSGKRLRDGERGLLVVTHLNRTGTCFLRFVVGDLCTIVHESCPHCGRNDGRIIDQPIRTMELRKIKGTLINPDVLKAELARLKELEEYQIVFTKEDLGDPYSPDKVVIKIAITLDANKEILVQQVKQKTHRAIEITPEVMIVEKNEIFDTTKSFKCQRVVDERPEA